VPPYDTGVLRRKPRFCVYLGQKRQAQALLHDFHGIV